MSSLSTHKKLLSTCFEPNCRFTQVARSLSHTEQHDWEDPEVNSTEYWPTNVERRISFKQWESLRQSSFIPVDMPVTAKSWELYKSVSMLVSLCPLGMRRPALPMACLIFCEPVWPFCELFLLFQPFFLDIIGPFWTFQALFCLFFSPSFLTSALCKSQHVGGPKGHQSCQLTLT